MATFDVKKIRMNAEKDYEQAWLETAEKIVKYGKLLNLTDKRRPHALFELIIKVRQTLLEMGFEEVMLPTIIEQSEVFNQYGPEASVILDRIFFLAGLDRPDIGLSDRRKQEIQRIIPRFKNFKGLQDIFRRYKKGKIESDDFVETMTRELNIEESQATALISLFKELKDLKPVPTSMTLRSHLSAGWFSMLPEIFKREPLPIQLFSIGPKFRREQQLDPTHLYDSWTASLVILAEQMSIEDGKHLVRQILGRLGFDNVRLAVKEATSKYYAPRTEFEVFVRHLKMGEYVEVGDAGFYSPVPLSKYGIPYPVFNFGMGLERLLMVMTGETDIRALVYPYLYKPTVLSDDQLAGMLKFAKMPESDIGKEMAQAILKVAEQHADEPSPCEFEAFDGRLSGRRVKVSVVEPEQRTKLIGPAGFNTIYVHDGNFIGVPPKGWEKDKFLNTVREWGVSTGIKYMDAFAAQAAHEIEQAAKQRKRKVKVRVKTVKLLSDINLVLDKAAQRYVTDNNKRIDVRGPVFTTIIAEIS